MPEMQDGVFTVEVALPGVATRILQTVRQSTLVLPSVGDSSDGVAPVKMRAFSIEGDLAVYHALSDRLLEALQPGDLILGDKGMALAAILASLWAPGLPGGQLLQVDRVFSWKHLEDLPAIREALGLRTDRYANDLLALSERNEAVLKRTEDRMLLVFLPDDNPALVATQELVSQDAALSVDLDDQVYLALLDATADVVTQESRAYAGSVRLPKSVAQKRLHRFVKDQGWPREQVQRALWQARLDGRAVLPKANAYVMEAVAEARELRLDEYLLFELAHVRSYGLWSGATLLPIDWDRILRSIYDSMSNSLREKLILVHTQPPGSFPAGWRQETDRLVGAYFRLHGMVVRGLRELEKTGSSGGKSVALDEDRAHAGVRPENPEAGLGGGSGAWGMDGPDTEKVLDVEEDGDEYDQDSAGTDEGPTEDGDEHVSDPNDTDDGSTGGGGVHRGEPNLAAIVPAWQDGNDDEREEETWKIVEAEFVADRNPKLLEVFRLARDLGGVDEAGALLQIAQRVGRDRTQVGRLLDRGLTLLYLRYCNDPSVLQDQYWLWDKLGLRKRLSRLVGRFKRERTRQTRHVPMVQAAAARRVMHGASREDRGVVRTRAQERPGWSEERYRIRDRCGLRGR